MTAPILTPVREAILQGLLHSDLLSDVPVSRLRTVSAYVEDALDTHLRLTPGGVAWAREIVEDAEAVGVA